MSWSTHSWFRLNNLLELYGSELQQEIDKDSAKYIRHSCQTSSASASPLSPSSPAPSPTTPIPVKISASYAEIQELATEKCALAQQLIELLSKTRARLDIDIVKVKMLQGDSPDTPTVSSRSGTRPLAATPTVENLGAIGRNPALAISESLRNAFALTSAVDSPSVTPAASSGPATKSKFHPHPYSITRIIIYTVQGRRLNATNSIKITPAVTPTKHRSASPATVTLSTTHATQQKSRLSRQIRPPAEDLDMDADGDDDAEEEIEDETLYCFCQKQSYGDVSICYRRSVNLFASNCFLFPDDCL